VWELGDSGIPFFVSSTVFFVSEITFLTLPKKETKGAKRTDHELGTSRVLQPSSRLVRF